MSRSSISSTQAPSSRLSTCTGSYEGDIESLALNDSEIENCSVHSAYYYSESWLSPTFPVISTGRSSSATLAGESSSLFESEYDTEISSSDTSSVIYTDSNFCRIQRTVGERLVDESAFVTEGDKRCKWETDGVRDSKINTAHGSAPSLYNAKPMPDEASHLRFNVNEDDFSQELYQSNASQQDCKHKDILTKFQAMDFENGAQARNSLHTNQKTTKAHELKALYPCKSVNDSCFNEVDLEDKLNTPETTIQELELAEREIIEKQRSLRKSFSSVLKEARRSVLEERENLRAHDMKLRSKRATSKYPHVREPRLTVKSDPNKEGTFENPVKWVITRPYQRSKKFIKQRKKQDAIELERRRAELLIMESKGLNLHEQAANVKSVLAFKDEKEKEYDYQLEEKRKDIKRKKSVEACHLKEEMKRKHLEEIRRKEEERKEKEDFERKKRIEEVKIRREKNRMLWESYNAVVLANSVSRSFTFSYFPKLRLQQLERPQMEPQKKTHSEDHFEKCHR